MEQLIRARESSNLGESVDGPGDVDWLRASGAVAQRHPLALSLWRLIEQGDRRALHASYDGMLRECPVAVTNPAHVVSSVLLWMLSPRCPVCRGRGKSIIPGTPTLSDHDCEACGGTGDRAPEWGPHERELYDRVTALRVEAALAIARKM